MTLPATNISFSAINSEFNKPAGTLVSFSDPNIRALLANPAGPVSLSELAGKTRPTYKFTVGSTSLAAAWPASADTEYGEGWLGCEFTFKTGSALADISVDDTATFYINDKLVYTHGSVGSGSFILSGYNPGQVVKNECLCS